MKTTNRVSKMRIWGKEYDTYVGKDGKVHIIKPLPSPIEEWASLGPFKNTTIREVEQ